jgi:hypothetical protein
MCRQYSSAAQRYSPKINPLPGISMDRKGARLKQVTVLQRSIVMWREFNECQHWKYPELPPEEVCHKLKLPPSSVDEYELERAGWFWNRRPKSAFVVESLYLFGAYLCGGVCLLLFSDPGLLLTVAWTACIYLYIMNQTVRRTRWRREYESCLARLIRPRCTEFPR